ncbi:hypothetical protein ACQ3G6_17765, partial [Allorhizobium undicola]|uniref:hypothetical protein n=1 Tax=Allorhizobium undicola TaxID=78527 RepID=UPI003D347B81
ADKAPIRQTSTGFFAEFPFIRQNAVLMDIFPFLVAIVFRHDRPGSILRAPDTIMSMNSHVWAMRPARWFLFEKSTKLG